jgi:hypothetical protein
MTLCTPRDSFTPKADIDEVDRDVRFVPKANGNWTRAMVGDHF